MYLEVFIPVLGPIVELAPGSVVISKESCTLYSMLLYLEVLIPELGPIDGLAPGSVVISKVAALAHELRDHPVEARALDHTKKHIISRSH